MTSRELTRLRKRYAGAFPSPPDRRDYKFVSRPLSGLKSVSLSNYRGKILNQGSLNSCTGHGTAGMLNMTMRRITGYNLEFNPFWIWDKARRLRGMGSLNEGAFVRDVFKVATKTGVIENNAWKPKNIRTVYKEKPPLIDPQDRIKFSNYYSINIHRDFDDIKQDIFYCLGEERLPVGVTIPIHPSFTRYNGESDIFKTPTKHEIAIGWHWMFAESADVEGVTLVNSWGKNWGKQGLVKVSWEYVDKYIAEAWTFGKELP